jgi:hypothetical protein
VALARAADAFAKGGYEIVSRSAAEYHLFFRGPTGTHRATLKCDGKVLAFVFDDVSEADRETLEQRVAAATGEVPSASSTRRCTTCGTLADAGAATCAVCGSAL